MSACAQCGGRGIYHPPGSQEYKACYLCDGGVVVTESDVYAPAVSPLEAAWAEADRLNEACRMAYNLARAHGPRPVKEST